MAQSAIEMRLIECVELDARTFMVTVRERWFERHWFRRTEHQRVKQYELAIRVGRWLDGDSYVLKPDWRHFRLWELFAAWRIEQKLNRVTALPTSAPLLDS